MAILLVTRDAEVEIVTDSAVESGFHLRFAIVASVDEPVRSLVVQIVQHGHG